MITRFDWPRFTHVFTRAAVDKDALGNMGDKAKKNGVKDKRQEYHEDGLPRSSG